MYTLLYHPKGIMSNLQDYIAKYHAGPAVTACSDCRRRFPYSALLPLDGRLLCDSCVETCDECGQEVPIVSVTYHSNNPHKRAFCPKCEAERQPVMVYCCECETLIDDDKEAIHTFEGFTYCETCYSTDVHSRHEYDSTPSYYSEWDMGSAIYYPTRD